MPNTDITFSEALKRMRAPIDFSKPHNYLLVDGPPKGDPAGAIITHYLDRYNTGDPATLCGLPADIREIETDPLGYLAGVECEFCRAELERRVLGAPVVAS